MTVSGIDPGYYPRRYMPQRVKMIYSGVLLDVGLSINHDNFDCQQLANFQKSKAIRQAIRLGCNGAVVPKVSSGPKLAE
jgi:hypothetical protein